jgi:hypothetical protein
MKLIFFITAIMFCQYNIIAQNKTIKELSINSEIYPILKSNYGKIEVVDNRLNKTLVIEVDSTPHSHLRIKYVLNPDLKSHVEEFYHEHIGSIAQHINKKMFFVIHDYNIYRDLGTISEMYKFRIKGDLFLCERSNCYLIKTIDTMLFNESSQQFKPFFFEKSRYILDFLLKEAESIPSDTLKYSKSSALNLDSFTKTSNKLYSSNQIKSGVYYSYSKLAESAPNVKFNRTSSFEIYKDLDKTLENTPYDISKDSIYAIVNNGKIMLRLNDNLFEVYKENDDFFSNIEIRNSKNYNPPPILFGGSFLVGAVGGLVWYLAMNAEEGSANWYKTKLNCRTGQLQLIQGIPKPKK